MTDGADRSTTYVHDALELFAGFGDREALVGDGRRLTYPQVAAEVRGLAHALTRHGVRPGAAVLVMLGNAVEGPLLQLALHLIGCRTMWIAPVTSRREIDEFARLARPDVFVHHAYAPDGLGDQIAASLPGVPVLRLGVELTADTPPAGAEPTADTPRADLPAEVPVPESFLQTSGTTGTPKLVHHRESFYRQVLALAAEFRAAGFPLLRHLSHSPMWLASGQITTLFNLFTGGVLFLRQQWDPAAFIATVEPSGSPPPSSPRRCSTRCSTIRPCPVPTSPRCSCSTWARDRPRPPGCARPSPGSARACASSTASARRW